MSDIEHQHIENQLNRIENKVDKTQSTLDMLYHTETKEGLIPNLIRKVECINGTVNRHQTKIYSLESNAKGLKWLAVKIGSLVGSIGLILFEVGKWLLSKI